MSDPSPEPSSRVAERLGWLIGTTVRVRVSYPEFGKVRTEEFLAVYHDTLPVGGVYFFVFEMAGKRRLIRTDDVLEISVTVGPRHPAKGKEPNA